MTEVFDCLFLQVDDLMFDGKMRFSMPKIKNACSGFWFQISEMFYQQKHVGCLKN